MIRFRNPADGDVTWDDLVKGPITIANHEIDDLVIVRADGVPTYNFAVVVDDWDMRISHVFRGDEHVNNTPWQINIFRALGAPLPAFAHVPIILGDDGQKLSKRRGAVSVTAYEDDGYLPEAMLNYLARLGWSHGDEEIFSREQMVAWFDGGHLVEEPGAVGPGQARLGQRALPASSADDARLAALATAQLARRGIDAAGATTRAAARCALFKDRCSTGAELADWLAMFFADVAPRAGRPRPARHRRRCGRRSRRCASKLGDGRLGQGRRSPPRSRRRSRRTASRCRSSRLPVRVRRLRPRRRRRRSTRVLGAVRSRRRCSPGLRAA